MDRGKILVISAPSGAGKTTLIKKLLACYPQITYSVSATTRAMRGGEVNGRDYFFISAAEFTQGLEQGKFIEWQQLYDYYYGTYRDIVEDTVADGRHILLELDVKGALRIKEYYPEAALIFIQPPSFEELKKRLISRNTESDEDLLKRIDRAEMELRTAREFDHLVVNRDVEHAFMDLKEIVRKIIQKEP